MMNKIEIGQSAAKLFLKEKKVQRLVLSTYTQVSGSSEHPFVPKFRKDEDIV